MASKLMADSWSPSSIETPPFPPKRQNSSAPLSTTNQASPSTSTKANDNSPPKTDSSDNSNSPISNPHPALSLKSKSASISMQTASCASVPPIKKPIKPNHSSSWAPADSPTTKSEAPSPTQKPLDKKTKREKNYSSQKTKLNRSSSASLA